MQTTAHDQHEHADSPAHQPFDQRLQVDGGSLIDQLREELRNTPCAIYLAELVGAWIRLPG
ncbi:hypothetical protein B7P34_01420 [Streptosporangium nondiastaticum]|uniref:Uncharacterized protein n=1 Tax=Streptosporangium nondiastaticum TaxID=35764 RepID=A0A9X7PK17_9ACTN|nr:hypothetical protein [Streptosporangium nondiastaticum]PSJ30686.1 hypothetical protein B7P34_01420 [Streptosporangium nondiastaticum]